MISQTLVNFEVMEIYTRYEDINHSYEIFKKVILGVVIDIIYLKQVSALCSIPQFCVCFIYDPGPPWR